MESNFDGRRSGGRSPSTPKRPREEDDWSTHKESNLFLQVENGSKRSRSNSIHDTPAEFCGLQEKNTAFFPIQPRNSHVYLYRRNQDLEYYQDGPSQPSQPSECLPSLFGLQAQLSNKEHCGREALFQIESPVISETQAQQADVNDEGNENIHCMENDSLCDKFTTLPVSKTSDWKRDGPLADEKALLEFDTCFGTIEVLGSTILPEFLKKGKSQRNIEIYVRGSLVILRGQQTLAYAGLLPEDAAELLSTLVTKYQTTLTVAIKHSNALAVTVYGLRDRGNSVGDLLSDKEYFLQQPEQWDSAVPYVNPQYLIRPGSEFQVYGATELESRSNHVYKVDPVVKSKINAVLDSAFGPTKFTEVQATNRLTTELKAHQKKALSMMVEKESGNIICPEFPSVWMKTVGESGTRYINTITGSSRPEPSRICLGGILADDMGLGKTLTTLALIAGSIVENKNLGSNDELLSRPTLIVTPLSTLPNWESQIKRHFKPNSLKIKVHHGQKRTKESEDLQAHDIVLTTYDTVKADLSKAAKTNHDGALHEIHWHRLVLDEAHIIRTRKTKVFQAVAKIKAQHRWCLTGTPIHNGIEDLGALVGFLQVVPFDNPTVFKNTFVVPVQNSESKSWERLTLLIKAISLRRTKESEEKNLELPTREDIIQPVYLDGQEKAIYEIVKRSFTLGITSTESTTSLFQTILRLRQVCNHGVDLLPIAMQDWVGNAMKSSDIPYDILQYMTCECCGNTVENTDQDIMGVAKQLLPCLHSVCDHCIKLTRGGEIDDNVCPICSGSAEIVQKQRQPPDTHVSIHYAPSSKVKAVLGNLAAAGEDLSGHPIKSLVFSNWTRMLDLLERGLQACGLKFERIDGSRTLHQRRQALENFKTNSVCTVLLATLGSAAVGLDLTAASQVHIVEPGWNPMLEFQALDRVYRLGQRIPVKSIRYFVDMDGSIEMHIRQVQQRKLELISLSFGETRTSNQDVRETLKEFAATLGTPP